MADTDVSLRDEVARLTARVSSLEAQLARANTASLSDAPALTTTTTATSPAAGPVDLVRLNVGGTLFTTTRSTLTGRESMLRAMFSGQHTQEPCADGTYFIDRDAKHFGKILNFLRDGEVPVSTNKTERAELLKEIQYYCLDEMTAQLETASPSEFVFDTSLVNPRMKYSPQDPYYVLYFDHGSNNPWGDVRLRPVLTSGKHSVTFIVGSQTYEFRVGVIPADTPPDPVLHYAGRAVGVFAACHGGMVAKVTVDVDARTMHVINADTHRELGPPQRLPAGQAFCIAGSICAGDVLIVNTKSPHLRTFFRSVALHHDCPRRV